MANILYLNQYFTTTLNVGGGINDSQTTGIIISDVSGIDTTKPGVALINYSSPLNTTICEWVEYSSINGSKELQGVVRGSEGFSAKSHSNGVAVAFPISESHINRLSDALCIGGSATNGITGTLDEDDMASNSAVKLATQQSIKAYVDTYAKGKAMFYGGASGASYSSGGTNYIYPVDIANPNATETNRQIIVPAITLKEIRIYIGSNTLNNNLVITVRDDAADTALTKTISAGATGAQTATVDAVVAANSLLSIKIDTTAAGSGSANIISIAVIYQIS